MGKPIYITETGIADAKDTLRAEWAESYYRAVGSLPLPGWGSLLRSISACICRAQAAIPPQGAHN